MTAKDKVAQNLKEGSDKFAGMTDSEIGEYNRALMFGDDSEAFPGNEEWATITD
jgi:hypothetical protein